jgi:uncharacterized membrane protein YeaQ/YmgE (transglycosylase-associated protein family)
MSFLTCIVLGLIAGFIGSKIVNHRGEGIFLDIILGIVGAVVGGWLFTALGGTPVSGNLHSLFIAVIGSAVVEQKSTKMLEMRQTLCEYHKLEAARDPEVELLKSPTKPAELLTELQEHLPGNCSCGC